MENWQPLERGYSERDLPNDVMEQMGLNEIWMNNIYQVNVRRHQRFTPGGMLFTWLSIKRRDKHPVRDWRHLQWIKNQLVGEENEGAELYPKESRLVDGSNQYHMWVLEDPLLSFPFGFHEGRTISEKPLQGGKQRPWPENMKPKDLEQQEAETARKLAEYNKQHKTDFK